MKWSGGDMFEGNNWRWSPISYACGLNLCFTPWKPEPHERCWCPAGSRKSVGVLQDTCCGQDTTFSFSWNASHTKELENAHLYKHLKVSNSFFTEKIWKIPNHKRDTAKRRKMSCCNSPDGQKWYLILELLSLCTQQGYQQRDSSWVCARMWATPDLRTFLLPPVLLCLVMHNLCRKNEQKSLGLDSYICRQKLCLSLSTGGCDS